VGNHATRNLHAGNNELGLMVIYYVTNRNISVDPDTETGGMTMKRTTTLVILLILLLPLFSTPPIVYARTAYSAPIAEDGDITNGFVKDNTSTTLELDIITNNRGYIEFNTSAIPAAAIITSVSLVFRTATASAPGVNDITVRQLQLRPTITATAAIYADIVGGVTYDIELNVLSNTEYTIDLGASAITHLTSHLTWFGVGMYVSVQNDCYVYSSESSYPPELLVDYYLLTDYEFDFTDSYFENGTVTTGVIVTASDSFSEQFNNSGGTTQYYPTMPSHFTWSIGGGITRTLHVVGEENITVTLPDGTDYIYTFTIKDYTGKTSIGQSYLEAWRIVNGVDTVIERMPIQQPNTIPLNLVYGKTYRLRILYADGSRYDWGYFVAGATSSLTLTIRATAFTDQVQIIYNDIFVEATRTTTGLNITVNYNDTRTNTIWANVTIRVRGGAVVVTQDYAIDSFTLDWDLANASLGYVVTVQGLHDDYGTWGYSKIFDQSETFADAPDLTGIFDFGLTGDVGAWVISFLVLLTFSKAMKARAVIAMVAMLTLLRYIGWSTAPWTYFYGYWLVAILISAGTGGGE